MFNLFNMSQQWRDYKFIRMPRKNKVKFSIYEPIHKSINSGRCLTLSDEAEIHHNKYVIQRIDLNSNTTLEAWQILSRLQANRLTHLFLTDNMLTTEACRYISRGNWPLLHTLWMRQNNICDAGVGHLAKAGWPVLQLLSLAYNQVTSQCLYHFKSCNWPKLLIFHSCNKSKEVDGVAQLIICPFYTSKTDRPSFLNMKILDTYSGSVMDLL